MAESTRHRHDGGWDIPGLVPRCTTVRAMSGRGERWSVSGVRHSVLVDWALRRVRREKEDETEKMSHVLFFEEINPFIPTPLFPSRPSPPHVCTPRLSIPIPFQFPTTCHKVLYGEHKHTSARPFQKIGPPCVEVSLGCSSSSQGCVPVQECHSQFCPVALKYWRPVIRMRPGRAANTIRHV